MAILRQLRDEAVRRVYRRTAVAYLILALATMALTQLIPPRLLQVTQTAPAWQSIAVTTFFIVVATIVVWRAHRGLTALLSLLTLYQAASHVLAANGRRYSLGTDAPLPEDLSDLALAREFLWEELASSTPLYQSFHVASDNAVALFERIRALPAVGSAIPSGGPTAQAATILYVCAVLSVLATLLLWRAVGKRPA